MSESSIVLYCSVREAAEVLGVSERSVRAACRAGQLAWKRIGIEYRILRSSLLPPAIRISAEPGTNPAVDPESYLPKRASVA